MQTKKLNISAGNDDKYNRDVHYGSSNCDIGNLIKKTFFFLIYDMVSLLINRGGMT